jgi:hypothetical protein
LLLKFFEAIEDISAGAGAEVSDLGDAGASGHEKDAARALDKDFERGSFAADYVFEGVKGIKTQQHLDIGKAQVGIEQNSVCTIFSEGNCQINGQAGLSHAALSAGNGQNAGPGTRCTHELT